VKFLDEVPTSVEQARDALTTQLADREKAVAALVEQVGITHDLSGIAAERGTIEARVKQLELQVSELEDLKSAANGADEQLEHLLDGVSRQVDLLTEHLARIHPQAMPANPVLSRREDLAWQIHLYRDTVTSELATLDEQTSRVELGKTQERIENLRESRQTVQERILDMGRLIAALLREVNVECDGTEPLTDLATQWSPLTDVSGELAPLEAQLQRIRNNAHHWNESADERIRATGLPSDTLNPEQCRLALDESSRQLRKLELALSIAQDVRSSIVRRVLPETQAYMRAILPELTAGRYHDVELVPDEGSANGADLRIRLWDELAGRHVAKNLFSGGTRDQTSLALRLAFALATLPRELGAMPGFIFLDEPLSSFDAERAEALINILTRGTIAQQFPQVFLISHNQTLRRSAFQYYVRLERGRVAEK